MKIQIKRKYESKYFSVLLAVLGCCLGVFYAKIANTQYDMVCHNEFARVIFTNEMYDGAVPMQSLAYPLYHICIRLLYLLLQIDVGTISAIVLSVSVVISVLLYRKLMLCMMERTLVHRYFADLASLGAVLFVTARSWLTEWRFYARQCAANPIHNPTTIFVRPFGIASFLFFVLYMKSYQDHRENKKYLLGFSIFIFLSVLAKPSFAFVFLPAMGIVTLLLMIQNKDILFGMKTLLAVMPTLILLLVQQSFVTNNTGMLTINIQFGSFSNFSLAEVFFVSLATFPVPILLFHRRSLKSNMIYCLSVLALVIGWIQMFFLTNGSSGDFSWGYDISVQFATVISLINAKCSNGSSYVKRLGYLVFAYQVMMGILYMFLVYREGNFWI